MSCRYLPLPTAEQTANEHWTLKKNALCGEYLLLRVREHFSQLKSKESNKSYS